MICSRESSQASPDHNHFKPNLLSPVSHGRSNNKRLFREKFSSIHSELITESKEQIVRMLNCAENSFYFNGLAASNLGNGNGSVSARRRVEIWHLHSSRAKKIGKNKILKTSFWSNSLLLHSEVEKGRKHFSNFITFLTRSLAGGSK